MTDASRSELGDFLRSRREKLTLEELGLPEKGRRRRTPGLRREEVAELAGIGVDWYVRLEQGRTVCPSSTTLDALAKALLLTKVERAHLNTLTQPSPRQVFVRETVPPAVRRLVEGLNHPAYVTGRRWDLLCWNKIAGQLFMFDQLPDDGRNILLYVLTLPGARRLFGAGWSSIARRMVAQFRITHDLYASDPAFLDLLERLRSGCPELAGWWETHDIRPIASGRKTLHHPKKGVLEFEHATFQANDDPALKLAIYTRIA